MKKTVLFILILIGMFLISGCETTPTGKVIQELVDEEKTMKEDIQTNSQKEVQTKIELKCPASCNDYDDCTIDYCNSLTDYKCVNEEIFPCCGNDICESTESYSSCPSDCPKPICNAGYLSEYKCDGNLRKQKYQYSNCNFKWFTLESCPYGCFDGECIQTIIIPLTPIEDETKEEDIYVSYVKDGDTVILNNGEEVRLIGIDAPESWEDYYNEAKHYLEELIRNRPIRLEKDVSERDIYKRLLRYIYVDYTFLNYEMVRWGYARAVEYPPDTKHANQLKKAEDVARRSRLGVWSEIGEEQEGATDSRYICNYNAYNCDNFRTHAEAQAVFEACGGVNNDVHRLDRDNDGLACESLS